MKRFLIFLFAFFPALLLKTQNNPNDVSIFSRVEAIALSQYVFTYFFESQAYEIEPAWLEAHAPDVFYYYKGDSTQFFPLSYKKITFDRLADCRIHKIYIEDSDFLYRDVVLNFEYDLQNRYITLTAELGIPGGFEPGNRVGYQYDADENLIRADDYLYNQASGTYSLYYQSNFHDFDPCGFYGKYTFGPIGATPDSVFVTNTYQSGCKIAKASFEAPGSGLLQVVEWTYDTAMRIQQIQYAGPQSANCFLNLFRYDTLGRRSEMSIKQCTDPGYHVIAQYGWNDNNSLAWLNPEPPAKDTIPRILVSYGACGKLVSKEPSSLQPAPILLSSTLDAGVLKVDALPENESFHWELLDMQGKIHASGRVLAPEGEIVTPATLPAGIYLLTLEGKKLRWKAKVLKYF